MIKRLIASTRHGWQFERPTASPTQPPMPLGNIVTSISASQIRAARALISCTQKDLSDRAGLSVNALNSIERGSAISHVDTLLNIQLTLEAAGIEFTSCNGVRQRNELLEIHKYEGPDYTRIYTDDVVEHMPDGGEVLYSNIANERRLTLYGSGQIEEHYKRIAKKKLANRLLLREGDVDFFSRRECYRWIDNDLFGDVPHIVYHHTICFLFWGPPIRMLFIHNTAMAEAFRKQFEHNWQSGKIPPLKPYEKGRADFIKKLQKLK